MALYKLGLALLAGSLTILPACSSTAAGKRADADADAKPDKPLQIRAVAVDQKTIRRNVESVGSTVALEEVTVSSEVEGKVDEVLVDIGDRVEADQPLVRVSTVE